MILLFLRCKNSDQLWETASLTYQLKLIQLQSYQLLVWQMYEKHVLYDEFFGI